VSAPECVPARQRLASPVLAFRRPAVPVMTGACPGCSAPPWCACDGTEGFCVTRYAAAYRRGLIPCSVMVQVLRMLLDRKTVITPADWRTACR
jgi:hypothetical protein